MLDWEGWVTCVVMVVGLVVMATDKMPPDFVFMAMLGILLTLTIITLSEALSGFSNSGLCTVMILFPVAEGISQTGGLDALFAWLLGKPTTLVMAQIRMMIPVAVLSAFLNNTPIVALLVPLIFGWAKGSSDISAQKLLIPLSFSSILGGTCTLIGTSTNLVIAGLQEQESAKDPDRGIPVFGMFDITIYGFPYAVFGLIYVLLFSPFLLPPLPGLGCGKEEQDEEQDELLVGLCVSKYSHIAGKTIEEAGLRNLDHLYLVSVERGGYPIPLVGPEFTICALDVLFFSGELKGVKKLAVSHGLTTVTDETEDMEITMVMSPRSNWGSPDHHPPRPHPNRSPRKDPQGDRLHHRASVDALVDTTGHQGHTLPTCLEEDQSPVRASGPSSPQNGGPLNYSGRLETGADNDEGGGEGSSGAIHHNGIEPSFLSPRQHPFRQPHQLTHGSPSHNPSVAGLPLGLSRVNPGITSPALQRKSPAKTVGASKVTNLLKAIVSQDSDLAGHSIRQVGFRRKFNASVVAVIRNGTRVAGKLGDVVVEPSDLLLMDVAENFDRFSVLVSRNFETIEYVEDEAREFMAPMVVIEGSSLAGKTITQADLRGLPGLFLVYIDRANGETLHAVDPETVLAEGDVLWFSGDLEAIASLRKVAGLRHQEDLQQQKVGIAAIHRRLVQAVIASGSPLVGRTVRDSRFRTNYGAAIVAIHRQGERLRTQIGEAVLKAGDVLLLDTGAGFVAKHKYNPTFALLAEVENSTPTNKSRMLIAGLMGLGMIMTQIVGVFTGQFMDLFTAALLASAGMLATGCLTGEQARKSINWEIFVTIGAAFGVSIAMDKTGVAQVIADFLVMVGTGIGGTIPLLIAIYIATAFLSNIIANNAAAAIMFPISFSVAEQLSIDYNIMSVTLMLGASSCYTTPFGYQTNLMVFGAGGYRTMDFIRFGGPLQLWLTFAFALIAFATVNNFMWILLILSACATGCLAAYPFIYGPIYNYMLRKNLIRNAAGSADATPGMSMRNRRTTS